ncbi:MAG: 50S ribosomal protein L32 [Patescibacteria group bacterium]
MRHTRAHTKNRRAHHALKNPGMAKCGNCGAPHSPHRVCMSCGFYRGRKVIDMAKRAEKALRKNKGKESKKEQSKKEGKKQEKKEEKK